MFWNKKEVKVEDTVDVGIDNDAKGSVDLPTLYVWEIDWEKTTTDRFEMSHYGRDLDIAVGSKDGVKYLVSDVGDYGRLHFRIRHKEVEVKKVPNKKLTDAKLIESYYVREGLKKSKLHKDAWAYLTK